MFSSFAAWRRDIAPSLRRSKTAPKVRLKPLLEGTLRSTYRTTLSANPVHPRQCLRWDHLQLGQGSQEVEEEPAQDSYEQGNLLSLSQPLSLDSFPKSSPRWVHFQSTVQSTHSLLLLILLPCHTLHTLRNTASGNKQKKGNVNPNRPDRPRAIGRTRERRWTEPRTEPTAR